MSFSSKRDQYEVKTNEGYTFNYVRHPQKNELALLTEKGLLLNPNLFESCSVKEGQIYRDVDGNAYYKVICVARYLNLPNSINIIYRQYDLTTKQFIGDNWSTTLDNFFTIYYYNTLQIYI